MEIRIPAKTSTGGYWPWAAVAVSSRSAGKEVLLWKKSLTQTLCQGSFLGVLSHRDPFSGPDDLLDPDAVPAVAQKSCASSGIVSALTFVLSGLMLCGRRVYCRTGSRGHSEKQALEKAPLWKWRV